MGGNFVCICVFASWVYECMSPLVAHQIDLGELPARGNYRTSTLVNLPSEAIRQNLYLENLPPGVMWENLNLANLKKRRWQRQFPIPQNLRNACYIWCCGYRDDFVSPTTIVHTHLSTLTFIGKIGVTDWQWSGMKRQAVFRTK